MGTTPVYGWDYPELSDHPDGATQIKSLALDVEVTLKNAIDSINTTITTQPLCAVYQTVAQTAIPTAPNPYVAILFDSEQIDTHDMHSTTTATSRVTAVKAGWYMCSGGAGWAANVTGRRGFGWYVNDQQAATLSPNLFFAGVASLVAMSAPTAPIYLDVGDYVELRAYQDSGVALALFNTAANRPWMCVRYIQP